MRELNYVDITLAGLGALTGIAKEQSAWVNGLSDGIKKTEIERAVGLMRTVIERLESTDEETST